jgi:iron complex outermembrane receptor protein
VLWLALVLAAVAATSWAQSSPDPRTPQLPPTLKQLTLEELMEIDVTLPTRRSEHVQDAASVFAGPLLMLQGNENFKAETLNAYEAGYRALLPQAVSLDVSVFHNRYDDLRSQETPTSAREPITIGNGLNAMTSGIEIIATAQPSAVARMLASYAYLTERLRARSLWC